MLHGYYCNAYFVLFWFSLYAGSFNHSDGQLSKESESGIDSPELFNDDMNRSIKQEVATASLNDNSENRQQAVEEKERLRLEKVKKIICHH